MKRTDIKTLLKTDLRRVPLNTKNLKKTIK